MEKNINHFITVIRQKNGRVKITHDVNNERNIYQLLHKLGYRKTKLDNKRIYFKETESDLTPVSIQEIRRAFYDLLKKHEFENVPDDVDYTSILNWFLEKKPIKENVLLNHYLEVELNDYETHILKIKADVDYKHKNEIKNVLSKFKDWGLRKTTDKNSKICNNAPLYYKNIGENKYLIFSHYNSDSKKNIDGFDCWIATYNNEKQIGKTKPIDIQDVSLRFNLTNDIELIRRFIE